ncbi:hypothetical protein DYB36_013871, partial [Aphanomyces astaci]
TFQGMGTTCARELELMSKRVKSSEASPTANAVKLLHDKLDGVLSVDDMMLALEALENATRATVFISMNAALRETWILRQVNKLRNE